MWSGQDGFADYCSYCDQEPPSALHAPLHPARLASTLAAAAERLLAPVQHALLEATATYQASRVYADQGIVWYKHANAEEEGCTVAVADHGDGRIIYFGDYAGGYYPCIARAVISLATHCPTPSSAAAPAKR